ncbi:hypothetical protein WISP_133847 [Willisornis vidua]|uniref:Uncharacterized protein n=1 Tax=Willisornis vidua TaxID=1566151 RepID=A0ABQ9CUB2_9PASS|nr:hypothetical protein WISP_133847 [Willisornis vidua]
MTDGPTEKGSPAGTELQAEDALWAGVGPGHAKIILSLYLPSAGVSYCNIRMLLIAEGDEQTAEEEEGDGR